MWARRLLLRGGVTSANVPRREVDSQVSRGLVNDFNLV